MTLEFQSPEIYFDWAKSLNKISGKKIGKYILKIFKQIKMWSKLFSIF
jgi:hypothetical protein